MCVYGGGEGDGRTSGAKDGEAAEGFTENSKREGEEFAQTQGRSPFARDEKKNKKGGKKLKKGKENAVKATSRDLQRYDVHRTGGYRITTTGCVLLAEL